MADGREQLVHDLGEMGQDSGSIGGLLGYALIDTAQLTAGSA